MYRAKWKSVIWQKLFSIHAKTGQHHEKSRIADEEEAHELLPAEANTKNAAFESGFPPPYVDNNEEHNNDDEKDDIESNQIQLKRSKAPEGQQIKHEKGFASRKASLLVAILLTVFLLLGLLILSRAGLTHDNASNSGTGTNKNTNTYPSPSAAVEHEGYSSAIENLPNFPRPMTSTASSSFTTASASSSSTSSTANAGPDKLHHPILRHSWTTLSPLQKQSYIAALQCLRKLPPLLPHMPTNASAYSDYPYIHAHIGYRTHNSASFLPWHRYFLSLYEHRLRESCDYDGGIPYWDWSADADAYITSSSADLSLSAVFDDVSGFGGNGNPDEPITAGQHGRCVTSGPFAGLQVLWYDVKYASHCLSRGFRTDETGIGGKERGKIDGSALTTMEINKILAIDSYGSFVGALEKKVHDVIPFGVGGDFETFSAPFEPLFWLHHAQLDRLWYLWQTGIKDQKKNNEQEDEGEESKGNDRVFEYSGHKFRHSIEWAGLDDTLEMGGVLGVDVRVRDVMDVEGGCAGGDGERSGILCMGYV